MAFRLDIVSCSTVTEVRDAVAQTLKGYRDLLPPEKNDLILLKPNLNSNMNSLTGNTTDLRILSAVILFLKEEGHTNIMIGEGTNSGFYRNDISVISRLGVDRLARYFGVKIKDLNYSDPCEILFDQGIKAHVAKEVMDARLLINLPKLKTHFENGMSVCLKNLMGCLVGQENKKKVHDNLAENILRLNDAVKPHLHIVDALVAMEGLGPTKGVPVRMDQVVVGTDPYLIDLVCAHMARFDYQKVRTLALAEKKGILTQAHFRFADSLDLPEDRKTFDPPKAGPIASFIHSPKRQKFFLKIRNTAFFTYLASTDWFGKLLFLTNLRQDVFLSEEMVCEGLKIDKDRCDNCGVCKAVCPLGLDSPNDEECIECLYCYSVCPNHTIQFKGAPGFFGEQLKQYDRVIRNLYKNKSTKGE